MKLPIQLSLEGEIIRTLKSRDINISGLVNDILLNLIKSDTASAEEVALAMLELEKNNQLKLIESHERQIEVIRLNIKSIDEKIKRQHEIIAELRRSERIAQMMQEVNNALLTSTIEDVQKLQAVQDLISEGIPIDERWLHRQLQRLELLGR
jgi:hypothetical protein